MFNIAGQNFKFVRLDGSMSLANRRAAINTFKENAQVRIFLISLKAGGLGLNLTAANYVFMLDLWWNPAVEDQVYLKSTHKHAAFLYTQCHARTYPHHAPLLPRTQTDMNTNK